VIDLSRSCSRYRLTLIDFVDRGEVAAETTAALAHLDRCTRCTEVVESTILTITALRRMGDEASGIEPPPDSWPRLRVRIQGWRRRPAVMSPLAGVAMSFAIVAVLVLPFRIGGGSLLGPASSPAIDQPPPASAFDRQIEATYLATSRLLKTVGDTAAAGSFPFNVPQEIRQVRKEVHSAKPTGRPTEPI
jgi:anti-sigma factor RsiW